MRDIRVPWIVFVGCIGPAFLCVLTIALIYVYLNLPLWTHGPELEAALEHFDRVQVAVFSSEEPPSALANVALDPLLSLLLDDLRSDQNPFYGDKVTLIEIAQIWEHTNDCSVVNVDKYYSMSDVAFKLRKLDGVWKVYQIVSDVHDGVFGVLSRNNC